MLNLRGLKPTPLFGEADFRLPARIEIAGIIEPVPPSGITLSASPSG